MSYTRSSAFKALQSNLAAARQVVKAANKINFGGKRKPLYRDSMLSSAVLLSFANFESYVSDVLNDMCKGFCAAKLNSAKLPAELRSQIAVTAKLSEWDDIEDPTKLQSRIWAHKTAGGFEVLNDNFVPANLDAGSIATRAAYPKLDNVIKLMRRVGIQKPRDVLRTVGGHTIEQKLTSIHDARAELAHTGKLPLWAAQDYIDRLDDLEYFARTLDRIFCRHFCRYASSLNWIK